jgi:hypothetical protein
MGYYLIFDTSWHIASKEKHYLLPPHSFSVERAMSEAPSDNLALAGKVSKAAT